MQERTRRKLREARELARQQFKERGYCDSLAAIAKAVNVSHQTIKRYDRVLEDWIGQHDKAAMELRQLRAELQRIREAQDPFSLVDLCRSVGITQARLRDVHAFRSALIEARQLQELLGRKGIDNYRHRRHLVAIVEPDAPEWINEMSEAIRRTSYLYVANKIGYSTNSVRNAIYAQLNSQGHPYRTENMREAWEAYKKSLEKEDKHHAGSTKARQRIPGTATAAPRGSEDRRVS